MTSFDHSFDAVLKAGIDSYEDDQDKSIQGEIKGEMEEKKEKEKLKREKLEAQIKEKQLERDREDLKEHREREKEQKEREKKGEKELEERTERKRSHQDRMERRDQLINGKRDRKSEKEGKDNFENQLHQEGKQQPALKVPKGNKHRDRAGRFFEENERREREKEEIQKGLMEELQAPQIENQQLDLNQFVAKRAEPEDSDRAHAKDKHSKDKYDDKNDVQEDDQKNGGSNEKDDNQDEDNNHDDQSSKQEQQKEDKEGQDCNNKEVNCNIHAFYYAWYGSPDFEGEYVHWNHEYLPHWTKEVNERFPKGKHEPPNDIGANYYPALDPYSSRDTKVIDNHMTQLVKAHVGVIIVSWYHPVRADGQGRSPDPIINTLLDACSRHGLKLSFHLEPFPNRTPQNVRDDLVYIFEQYGDHPALYRVETERGKLPMFYLYDSYIIPAPDWAQLLSQHGKITVRGTPYDAIYIGLLVEQKHKNEIIQGGFDGFYTYFASNGFTYGSTINFWKDLNEFATTNQNINDYINLNDNTNLIFIPSVGPGYMDTRVRAWNDQNTKHRDNGRYYTESFHAAIESGSDLISITSFNEWHEGSQIEEAIPYSYLDKKNNRFNYLDYTPNQPDFYLQLTAQFVDEFEKSKIHLS